MKNKKCPHCQASLIQDGDEKVEIDAFGNILFDADIVFVCSNACGYTESLEEGSIQEEHGPNL